MKSKIYSKLAILLILVLIATLIPGCSSVEAAESYMAIIPKVLHSGSTEVLSLSLIAGDKFVSDEIEITLLKDGEKIAIPQHDLFQPKHVRT